LLLSGLRNLTQQAQALLFNVRAKAGKYRILTIY
jgi:hypothetical protein